MLAENRTAVDERDERKLKEVSAEAVFYSKKPSASTVPSGSTVAHPHSSVAGSTEVRASSFVHVSEAQVRYGEQSDDSSEKEVQEQTRTASGPGLFARTASAAASFIAGVTAQPAPVSALSHWEIHGKKRRRKNL